MRLTATNQIIELVTTSTANIEVTAHFHDMVTSPAFTPGSQSTAISSATDTTIVSAPAASTYRRVLYISIRNSHASSSNTITVQKDVAATEYRMTGDITLGPGEWIEYIEGAGWKCFDSAGRLKTREVVQGAPTAILTNPVLMSAGIASTRTMTSNSTFATYCGQAPRALTSITMRVQITTASATITWAEAALYKGTAPVAGSDMTLTPVGYTDVSAVINSTGRKTIVINVSSGQVVNEGDHLWLALGNQATTAAVVRAASLADDLQCGTAGSRATHRPSTNIGSALLFTTDTTDLMPWWHGYV